ncbi:MAG: HAD family phosphatase [Clostridia bacterium]|nr:HAD family phosphatase [Clostridia bacterium]
MIRNIVFDMGKVLLEYDPYQACYRHAQNVEKALVVKAAIFDHPDWPAKIDGGLLYDDEYLIDVQDRLDTPELKELAARVLSDWWLDTLFPKQGMKQLIENLLEKGYRLYVLSNCGYTFRKFEYKIPCVEQFSGILVSAEELLLKPDVKIFERLCEKFDLQMDECVFVDDLQKNVDGAVKAGMQGYCFADGDVAKLAAYLNELNA